MAGRRPRTLPGLAHAHLVPLDRQRICRRAGSRTSTKASARRPGRQPAPPHAVDVRVDVDPVLWFLNDKDDTRSSYYLEDAATEFQVQGLELDWTCVTWDADLRFHEY